MKTTLLSLVALGALTAAAIGPVDRAAGEPFELNAAQMDAVTGGYFWIEIHRPSPSQVGRLLLDPMAQVEGEIVIDASGIMPGAEIVPPEPIFDIIPPAPGFNG